jgi:uncharacterized membrane protein YtjA (UPF0391 family)
MVYYSLVFFIVSILAALISHSADISLVNASIAKALSALFLIIAIVSYIVHSIQR